MSTACSSTPRGMNGRSAPVPHPEISTRSPGRRSSSAMERRRGPEKRTTASYSGAMSEYRIRFQRLVSKITTPPSCAPCGADPRSGARPPARQGLAARLQFRFETAAHQLAELEDRRVGDPVVDVQALLAAAHHPVPEQEVEVLGDVRLARARLRDELGHGLLAAPERVEDPEPHGLGKDLEAAGHEFEGLVAEAAPHGSRLHCWMPIA